MSESHNPNAPKLFKNTKWHHKKNTRFNKPILIYENKEERCIQEKDEPITTIERKDNNIYEPINTPDKRNKPTIIPPDKTHTEMKKPIAPRQSTIILSTKRPARISQSAVYYFLGNTIQMNEMVIRPKKSTKTHQSMDRGKPRNNLSTGSVKWSGASHNRGKNY